MATNRLTFISPPAMKMPMAKSRESPGRIGKNRPHSTKTITSDTQKNAVPYVSKRY